MKITVAKPDLEKALKVVNVAVGSGGSDLSTHYLFRATEDGAEVLAFNKRIFASSPLHCVVDAEEDDGATQFTAAAWRVGRWLEGCRDGALSLMFTDKTVKLIGARTTIRCQTLDPSKFPFWDEGLKGAESKGKLNPGALAEASAHSGKFTAEEDTTQPQLAQVEARDGALWASDRYAVSMVDVDDASDMSVRIHTKDVSALVRFLQQSDYDIEVLEDDKTSYFRSDDGTVFGVSRPLVQFPKLKIDREAEPAASFELPVEDLRDAVLQLSAGAAKDDKSMNIRHKEGNLVLSMDSDGVDGHCEFPITGVNITNGEAFDEGFNVEYNYLQAIGASFNLDTLTFGVHPVGNGGYLSFRHSGDDDATTSYYTVIVWKN